MPDSFDNPPPPSVAQPTPAGGPTARAQNGAAADANYRPGREIARGGMGAVLNAHDEKLDRSVAMKVMLRADASLEERQRFELEARVLGRLAHPNIVPIHDLGTNAQGRLFYTMKLVQGVTLHELLGKLKAGDAATLAKYPLTALLTVFQKVCDAVAFAHSQGIIHRDLKPQNIMVGEFGEVLVMDWGLAKILPGGAAQAVVGPAPGTGPTGTLPLMAPAEEPATLVSPPNAAEQATLTTWSGAAEEATLVSGSGGSASIPALSFGTQEPAAPSGVHVTLEGAVMGTPHYMSPEQAEGRVSELDRRSDIFSLGGILYALLTLRPPVEGDSLAEILAKVCRGTIASPTAFNAPSSITRAKATATGAVTAPRPTHPLLHCPNGKVPAALSAVVMKALTRDKTRRYQTVAAFTQDLTAYQGGFATTAENANALTLLWLFLCRHKGLAAAAALIVLLTMGFLAKVISSERKAQAHARTAATNEATALATLADLRRTAPVFYTQAKVDFAEGKRDAAIEKLGYAIQLAATNADYHLLRAHLRQSAEALTVAAEGYRQVLTLRPADAVAQLNLGLCENLLRDSGGAPLNRDQKLQLLEALRQQQRLIEAAPLAAQVDPDTKLARHALLARLHELRKQVGWDDNTYVKTLPDGTFKLRMTGLAPIDFSVLKGTPVSVLELSDMGIADLSSLAGVSLKALHLRGATATDLSPLRGMPLEWLELSRMFGLTDISALRGMPLEWLDLSRITGLTNLAALRGMPLRSLNLSGLAITDVNPLADCHKLEEIWVPGLGLDLSPLRQLPRLRLISTRNAEKSTGSHPAQTAAEFWKEYDANQKPAPK